MMTTKKAKAWGVGTTAAIVAMGTLLTACSTGSQKPAEQAAADNAPTAIEMMTVATVAEIPKETSDVQKEVEKLTNTKLNLTWVPETAYNDKLTATLASGTLPQVMYSNQTKSAGMINAARAGAFWEIGPYLKDYPNLSKLDREVMMGAAIDGKIYGLVRYRDAARHVITYRKDWLDKLGLQPPKTIDDFYKVAKAFTENDPDGNGKNDTVGFVEDALNALTRSISVYHGAPMAWGIMNGQVVPNFITPEFMEGLKFERKLFADKLMNPDFSIVNAEQRRTMMAQGKAGMMIAVETDAKLVQENALKLNPKAQFDMVQGVTGPKGLRVSATPGFLGMFVFSKSSIKTETDLKKILGFFDKLSTPENMTLLTKGIKDVDYKMADGFVEPIAARADVRKADGNYLNLAVMNPSDALPLKMTPIEAKGAKLVAENRKIAIYDESRPLMSQTQVEKWPELNKIAYDAQIKFIMGEIDEEGYKKAMDQFRKNGGDQVIKEYTDNYNQIKGKK
jgi:putative aldouronate transport system substrate-binding protein